MTIEIKKLSPNYYLKIAKGNVLDDITLYKKCEKLPNIPDDPVYDSNDSSVYHAGDILGILNDIYEDNEKHTLYSKH